MPILTKEGMCLVSLQQVVFHLFVKTISILSFENKKYSKKLCLFLQYSMIEGIFRKGYNIPWNIPILFSSCVVVLFHFKWHIMAGLPGPLGKQANCASNTPQEPMMLSSCG